MKRDDRVDTFLAYCFQLCCTLIIRALRNGNKAGPHRCSLLFSYRPLISGDQPVSSTSDQEGGETMQKMSIRKAGAIRLTSAAYYCCASV